LLLLAAGGGLCFWIWGGLGCCWGLAVGLLVVVVVGWIWVGLSGSGGWGAWALGGRVFLGGCWLWGGFCLGWLLAVGGGWVWAGAWL